MFFKSKEQKKIDKLKKTMIGVIENFENELNDFSPSCKEALLKAVSPLLQRSITEAKEWGEDFDYVNTAYCVLYNTGFNLLASGKFHIFRGELNPMNESQHLYTGVYSERRADGSNLLFK